MKKIFTTLTLTALVAATVAPAQAWSWSQTLESLNNGRKNTDLRFLLGGLAGALIFNGLKNDTLYARKYDVNRQRLITKDIPDQLASSGIPEPKSFAGRALRVIDTNINATLGAHDLTCREFDPSWQIINGQRQYVKNDNSDQAGFWLSFSMQWFATTIFAVEACKFIQGATAQQQ